MVRSIPLEWMQWLGTGAQLKHVLERLDINCVLDVGANEGQFGVALRGSGYKGWIVSFEPVSDVFRILEKVAKANPPWRVFPYALGAAHDKLTINVYEMRFLSSFLLPREESLDRFPENRVVKTEPAEMRRLDDILADCLTGIAAPRIYLKLDTQGFDLEVMKGAEAALKQVLALQTEVSFKNIYIGMPSYMDSLREFQARGFDVVAFSPVTSDLDGLSAIEMDCIMTRRRGNSAPGELQVASQKP